MGVGEVITTPRIANYSRQHVEKEIVIGSELSLESLFKSNELGFSG